MVFGNLGLLWSPFRTYFAVSSERHHHLIEHITNICSINREETLIYVTQTFERRERDRPESVFLGTRPVFTEDSSGESGIDAGIGEFYQE